MLNELIANLKQAQFLGKEDYLYFIQGFGDLPMTLLIGIVSSLLLSYCFILGKREYEVGMLGAFFARAYIFFFLFLSINGFFVGKNEELPFLANYIATATLSFLIFFLLTTIGKNSYDYLSLEGINLKGMADFSFPITFALTLLVLGYNVFVDWNFKKYAEEMTKESEIVKVVSANVKDSVQHYQYEQDDDMNKIIKKFIKEKNESLSILERRRLKICLKISNFQYNNLKFKLDQVNVYQLKHCLQQ